MALIGQEKSTVRGAIALVQDNDTFSGFLYLEEMQKGNFHCVSRTSTSADQG
jgi:hypothetical protein